MPRHAKTATTPMKIRLPAPLRAALERATEANATTLNGEIVRRLSQSLAQETAFGDRELSAMAFGLASSFAVGVGDGDWRTDPAVYARGAGSVVAALIRDIPGEGQERALTIHSIISSMLTGAVTALEPMK